jgi:hypothetical protein
MNTMSQTITAPKLQDDRPRRRALGLAVLLLTLGAGYTVARLDAPPVELSETDDADAADARRGPTVAEIMEQIDEVATRHRVPPRLVAAIVAVESEFNPRAVSRRGAQGLMQLMPATAASVSVQDSFDARENIEGGVRHLRALMDRYHHDLPLVLAAYNAGDRAVLAYGGVPPYPETRRYVIRVLRRYDPEAAQAAARRMSTPPARPRVAYQGVATPAVLRVPVREVQPVRELQPLREVQPVSEQEPARVTGQLRLMEPAASPASKPSSGSRPVAGSKPVAETP